MPHVSSFRAAVGDLVSRWAVESQHAARRNAMVASTDLAARRQERRDVEDYLAERQPSDELADDAALGLRRGL